ncbi:hypothetical protein H072_9456 [Dactylellina haptotyla CBS 200.50]|uniref:Uncharacterized protein n=1 Tax=Dactylellina haptotyla (strain CBS 200.50) TaxID=1284197 RepID=S8A1Z1_DACHA|nr:hypothetical protein H072_9456 [Dactylellina haptotyla CBS 200.50]
MSHKQSDTKSLPASPSSGNAASITVVTKVENAPPSDRLTTSPSLGQKVKWRMTPVDYDPRGDREDFLAFHIVVEK